ncbi:hypothetical protein EON80_02470 [bacterium]|nr:MAG: hypothetical protein EON80_02470 [bacterium]
MKILYPLGALLLVVGGCQSANLQSSLAPTSNATGPALATTAKTMFERIAQVQGEGKTAEIVTASSNGKTLLYNDATGGRVGFVNIEDPAKPKLTGLLKVGGEPTSVAITHDDKWGLTCSRSADVTAKSELVIFDFATRRIARRISLTGQPDCLKVSADNRYAVIAIENERGDLEKPMPQLPAGFVTIVDLQGTPDKWKLRNVQLPNLPIRFPTDPEPEFISINAKNEAAITLQENNGVVIIDLAKGKVLESWSCGTAEHAADLTKDDEIKFTETLKARREPDALGWTPGGNIMTANEGDYDLDEKESGERAGSRSASLFDRKGKLIWDSANELDEAAAQNGSYKDKRSPKKGSEPEGVEIGVFGGKPYAFIGCERAEGMAVYDLSDETKPAFVQWLKTGENPEGLLAIPSRNLIVSANEGDNTLSIFQMK